MLFGLPLAVVGVCSTLTQDCPSGQMCVAEWDPQAKRCPAAGRCEPRPEPAELELALPIPAGEQIACGKGNRSCEPNPDRGAACGNMFLD